MEPQVCKFSCSNLSNASCYDRQDKMLSLQITNFYNLLYLIWKVNFYWTYSSLIFCLHSFLLVSFTFYDYLLGSIFIVIYVSLCLSYKFILVLEIKVLRFFTIEGTWSIFKSYINIKLQLRRIYPIMFVIQKKMNLLNCTRFELSKIAQTYKGMSETPPLYIQWQ